MASCDKASMWPENRPDGLQDLCLYLLASDMSIIAQQRPPQPSFRMDNVSSSVDSGVMEGEISVDPCDFGASSEVDPETARSYNLHPGVCLPTQLADSLFTIITRQPDEAKEHRHCHKAEKLQIFSDKQTASLSRVDLRHIHEKSLVSLLTMLASHPLVELTMPCVWRCLPLIKNINTLRSLRLEKEPQNNLVDAFIQGRPEDNAESIHELGSQVDGQPVFSADEEDFTLTCPNLRRLILRDLQFRSSGRLTHSPEFNSKVVQALLSPLQRLSHLSLSSCHVVLEDLDCLGSLTTLVWLNLANIHVEDFSKLITILQPLQHLQHLDLSHGDEEGNPLIYSRADGVLKKLMDTFPQLASLDLSGTNLAGFEPPETVSHRLVPAKESAEQVSKCSIPGLEGRHLEFLGLYGSAYGACRRQNIPATRVTGDADWIQVVLAVQVYVDNQLLLIKALNDLFSLFRYSTVVNHCLALEGVLAAMRGYPMDNSIQIAGSASLFYIAKGEHKQFITYHYKREMVHLLLVAMCQHSFDQTMMRNACLTLCHLNLPTDVMFCYERLVRQLLDMLKYDYRDEFIHRLGIFLLNCLACQVDGKEKELVGRLGAVETMLVIINRKLRLGECDDVLEVAWSTLWNVTDETPVNCEKFLNKGGMQLFVNCLQKFDKKPELLRNMMGLMGNIAEVDSLRKHLMTEDYVQIFSNLLESESDGIEVSYNACGVLSHICFDGAQAWKLKFPSRCYVMARMREAIMRWPLHSKRNINYRSFEPILRLINHYETPVVQLWACWALCNLTTVSSEKYCRLLEREGGRATLQRLISDPRPDKEIQDLALRTLHQLDAPLLEGSGGNQDMEGQEAESDDEDNAQQEQMEEGEDLGEDNGDGQPLGEDEEGSDVDEDGPLWGQDPV